MLISPFEFLTGACVTVLSPSPLTLASECLYPSIYREDGTELSIR